MIGNLIDAFGALQSFESFVTFSSVISLVKILWCDNGTTDLEENSDAPRIFLDVRSRSNSFFGNTRSLTNISNK